MSATAVRPQEPPAAWRPTPPPGPRPGVRARLTDRTPTDGRRALLVTVGITAIAAVLRLIGLAHPKGLIFDEVYYAQDAHSMLNHGVEWDPGDDGSAFVAHPPFGKWLISTGETLLGYDEVGWRIAAAVAGIIGVAILIRLVRRLTGSSLLGGTAGLLLAVEGSHLVLSRTSLLDIFLATLILAAMYCLVRDRTWRCTRWLRAIEDGLDPVRERPFIGIPWWRIACGVLLGLSMSTKWSAVWYIIVCIVLFIVWNRRLRIDVGARKPVRDTVIYEFGQNLWFGLLAIGTYLATWIGWFANDTGSYRHWLTEQGRSEPPVFGALVNWWEYHMAVLDFHAGLSSTHSYQSTPMEWLFNIRPVVFFWSSDVACGTDDCAAEVLLLGTPLLWWTFVPATLALLAWALYKRDWRAWFALGGIGAGILPWFAYPDRTMFFFYTAPAVPFFIIAVTWCLGMIIGIHPVRGTLTGSPERRLTGALIAGAFIAVVVLCFAYFWPIYTGEALTRTDWHARMWLKSWI
ncbi:dolichyl-phosphate-mannose--protein mannosyltransferase [Glycomyces buryatensis]|uniref:Polyprenol-phosphate-mannose--protein mannosyltransferase n=1 Tax=Glycomyces buryatensis TaxID=2570927 RepID=A0A4S8QDB1_9ACTN|nr:phospholipid carrier-dependent glycosyltransferase [Glycomyces buryatensis]THV42358.1 phospholipid carrier-dependent glycosyltransferase [Glycomyces buryatensis]